MVTAPPQINEELLIVPISKSLLIPCSKSYPLVKFTPEDSLKQLYQNFLYNLGQVHNCYRKDESLIQEVNAKESELLESIRRN